MVLDLDPGVEKLLESPGDGEEVNLIVEVESPSEEARDQIASVGEIRDELPLDCFAVTVQEDNIEQLANLSPIVSIEYDDEATTFNPDFLSHRG